MTRYVYHVMIQYLIPNHNIPPLIDTVVHKTMAAAREHAGALAYNEVEDIVETEGEGREKLLWARDSMNFTDHWEDWSDDRWLNTSDAFHDYGMIVQLRRIEVVE